MTDVEIAAALWSVYQRYVGKLNTAETRASFCVDVQAVLGPNQFGQQWIVCNDSNNPPTLVAEGGLGFEFWYTRNPRINGEVHYMTNRDLDLWHRAGLLDTKKRGVSQ